MSLESLPKNILLYILQDFNVRDLKDIRTVNNHFSDVAMVLLAKVTMCNTLQNCGDDFLKKYGQYFLSFRASQSELERYLPFFKNIDQLYLNNINDLTLKSVPKGITTFRVTMDNRDYDRIVLLMNNIPDSVSLVILYECVLYEICSWSTLFFLFREFNQWKTEGLNKFTSYNAANYGVKTWRFKRKKK